MIKPKPKQQPIKNVGVKFFLTTSKIYAFLLLGLAVYMTSQGYTTDAAWVVSLGAGLMGLKTWTERNPRGSGSGYNQNEVQ